MSTLSMLQQAAPRTRSAALALAAFALATPSVAFASSPQERSFIMVKPDGVNRGLVGDIIARFERKGYKLVGAKVLVPSEALAKQHYAEHDGRPFFPKLVSFLSSGPVVALVFEGRGVVATGRQMIGVTNPLASAPGSIRGDFGIDVGRNIIHGSDSTESAQREIALWFSADELAAYEKVIDAHWVYEN
jgi:nucleoside-diphosphate kinase